MNNDNNKDNRRNDRFESYPKPTETDQQLNNQPEYIDQQPNDFHDKTVSDIPVTKYDRNKSTQEDDIQQSDES